MGVRTNSTAEISLFGNSPVCRISKVFLKSINSSSDCSFFCKPPPQIVCFKTSKIAT